MRHIAVALTWVCLVPFAAEAQTPASVRTHGIAFELSSISYSSFFSGTGSRLTGGVAWSWVPAASLPLEVGGGLRFGRPAPEVPFPAEAFARARLVASVGPWQPALGPELGFSGLSTIPANAARLPEDLTDVERSRVGAAYLSFDAAPLRFRFGRFTVSALELALGTTLAPMGASVRTEVGFLHVGVTL